MQVERGITNNAVYSRDESGREIIVVGKGVGFKKKKGDPIDRDKVEKIFRFAPERSSQFAELVEAMPYEHIQLAAEIIAYAETQVHHLLNRNIYITLTDHMNFAIERYQKGIFLRNALLWEIKKFYPLEFEIGQHAVELVKERTGIQLPEDEAGFFALHVVNAEMEGDTNEAVNFPAIIKGSLDIVRYHFGITLDEDSLAYERFVTHLKFLIQRIIQHKNYGDTDAASRSLWKSVQQSYPDSYACAKKVLNYIHQRIQSPDSDEELSYLTIHIERMVRSRYGDK